MSDEQSGFFTAAEQILDVLHLHERISFRNGRIPDGISLSAGIRIDEPGIFKTFYLAQLSASGKYGVIILA